MPVIDRVMLRGFQIPLKRPGRPRIAISHEFVELYRGDKDLRVGKILCQDYGCEIVHLGTDIASPADSRVFNTKRYPVEHLGPLPEDYHLLLMRTRLVTHRRGNISLGGFFRWTPGITSELLRWQPDLILENPYLTLTPRSYSTMAVSRKLGIPLVYLDCGDIISKLALKHKLVLPFERRIARQAAHIITYNREGKKRFVWKYGIAENKIDVIPKPVDISQFKRRKDVVGFRSRFGLEGKFVVAYFGRLCTNKGARYLLDAADILRQRGHADDVVFLFVGGNLEADQAAEFKAHLERLKLDNVRLTGMMQHDDMPQAYAATDVAVFPDLTNLPAFPTVLAETMAAGLPIVIGIKGWEDATPIVNGETGFVIEARNPILIADRLELLRSHAALRRRLSDNVATYASEHMDYPRVVARYYEIFKKLIPGHKVLANVDESRSFTPASF